MNLLHLVSILMLIIVLPLAYVFANFIYNKTKNPMTAFFAAWVFTALTVFCFYLPFVKWWNEKETERILGEPYIQYKAMKGR